MTAYRANVLSRIAARLLIKIAGGRAFNARHWSNERLRVIGEWLRAYGGTIHGAEGVATPCGFPMMRKGNTLYLHQFLWRGPEMRFTHCPGTVRRAWLVKSGAEAQFTQNGDVVFLSGLPEAPEDPVDTVIAVELA